MSRYDPDTAADKCATLIFQADEGNNNNNNNIRKSFRKYVSNTRIHVFRRNDVKVLQ
jgi:hypothetical protein